MNGRLKLRFFFFVVHVSLLVWGNGFGNLYQQGTLDPTLGIEAGRKL